MHIGVVYIGGSTTPIRSQQGFSKWFDQFGEMSFIARVSPIFIYHGLATIEPAQMIRAARRIKKEWNKFDGFVVMLPIDQLLICANMLAFFLGIIGKPVVCVSANEHRKKQEALSAVLLKSHVINAIQLATTDTAGTVTMAGLTALSATSAVQVANESGVHIDAAKQSVKRMVHFGVQTKHAAYERNDNTPQLQLDFDNSPEHVTVESPEQFEMVIIEGPLVCAIKDRYWKAIAHRVPPQWPVLLLDGEDAGLIFEGTTHALVGLAPLAATVKFKWVLGQMQRKDLPQHDQGRSVLDWMVEPVIDELY